MCSRDPVNGGEESGDRGHFESDLLGAAFVIEFRGDVLTVSSSRPQPPGTRVVLAEPEGEVAVQGKVTDVSMSSGGWWEVRVKLFAPSKKARQRLEELAR